MTKKPAGLGRKHPQLDVSVTKLFLDTENPRLPEEIQGKKEKELLASLYRDFSLNELADSMSKNGYFDEEPLVAIPKKLPRDLATVDLNSKEFLNYLQDDATEFVVVEGNRRLATVKLLTNQDFRDEFNIKSWPTLSKEVHEDLIVLPVIVYQKRSDVVPYLGVRHIVGIQRWDSYAKARYIAKMIDDGLSVGDIEELIGDRSGTLIKNYLCYKIIEQASNEFNFDINKAKNDFSLLLLAIGQGGIKRFLGLPVKIANVNTDTPIPEGNLENLQNLVLWIFGSSKERPVIRESRDITNYLSHIVNSKEAIDYLKDRRDLQGAYDRTDGEEKMVLKYLNNVNNKLESVLGVVHRHKTPDVLLEVEKGEQTIKAILKIVRGSND